MGIRRNTAASATIDILQQKQREVVQLTKQANDAVDIVTRTMNDLESVNQQIDAALSEIDAYTQELAATRDAMSKQRKHNTVIIGNFAKLLDASADTDEGTGE